MRLILDLPQELERELSLEAARLGLPLTEYALRILSTARTAGNAPKTGAELVAHWQNEGLIGTRPDIADSQEHAREIRAAAESGHKPEPMYLLDTDVLIDIQRGHAPALTWFATLSEVPSVPGIVVMELAQDAKNRQQVRQALKLVAPLPIVWPTEADCQRARSDFTAYHLPHGVGILDSLIAACAIGLSATLCTFNVKHYRVISGFVTAQPYSR